ncbi:hypothetical protein ACM66B_005888 [Microbotryomycetes sp. NB124-2]
MTSLSSHRRLPSRAPSHLPTTTFDDQRSSSTRSQQHYQSFKSFQNGHDYISTRRNNRPKGFGVEEEGEQQVDYDGDKLFKGRQRTRARKLIKTLFGPLSNKEERSGKRILVVVVVLGLVLVGGWFVWRKALEESGVSSSSGKQGTFKQSSPPRVVVDYAKELRDRVKPVVVGDDEQRRGNQFKHNEDEAGRVVDNAAAATRHDKDDPAHVDANAARPLQVKVPKGVKNEDKDDREKPTKNELVRDDVHQNHADTHPEPKKVVNKAPNVKLKQLDQDDAGLPNELWRARMARFADKIKQQQQQRQGHQDDEKVANLRQGQAVRHPYDDDELSQSQDGHGVQGHGHLVDSEQEGHRGDQEGDTKDEELDEDGGYEPQWDHVQGGKEQEEEVDSDEHAPLPPTGDLRNQDDEDFLEEFDLESEDGSPPPSPLDEDEGDDGYDERDDAITRAKDDAILNPDVELVEHFEILSSEQRRQLSSEELKAFKDATVLERRKKLFLERLRMDGEMMSRQVGMMPPEFRPRFRDNRERREVMRKALDRVWPKEADDGGQAEEDEDDEVHEGLTRKTQRVRGLR